MPGLGTSNMLASTVASSIAGSGSVQSGHSRKEDNCLALQAIFQKSYLPSSARSMSLFAFAVFIAVAWLALQFLNIEKQIARVVELEINDQKKQERN